MTHPDLEAEQRHLDAVFRRLEEEIAAVQRRLADARAQRVGGLHQARFEREAFVGNLEDRLAALKANRRDDVCFGRIDMADGVRFYIGRLGLTDAHHEPLLIDWRAPAAAPFYQATPREPLGVVRRRHFLTRARQIVDIEDEVLDVDRLDAPVASRLRGEAALQYAMGSARTGRMREIAATIQKEQDEIIRAPITPTVFVQGGPGTGKTAVALHRAAYLLYSHRRHLSPGDVLVVGPSPVFLRYIERVLPSLGETGATLTPVPGVYARRSWSASAGDLARHVMARPQMAEVISRAIATRQRPLARRVRLSVEGERVTVAPSDTRGVVRAARRRRGRHNDRAAYVHDRLLKLVWRRAGPAVHDRMEFEDFRSEWLTHPAFRRLSQRVWPTLTAEQLLNDLFGFEPLLREATTGLLDDTERRALAHPWEPEVAAREWRAPEAPLLDEAAAQLGPIPDDLDPRRRRTADEVDAEEARAEAEYTRQLLRGLGGGIVPRRILEERLAGEVLGRHGDADDPDEAVVGGRIWRYAVVDEAQDVTPMAWRMIGRRAPRRAATVVGDLAQGTEPWSPSRWEAVRSSLGAPEEARIAELTINYRTPSEIADWAATILERVNPSLRPPSSPRSVPGSFAAEATDGDLVAEAVDGLGRVREEIGEGIACLVTAPSRVEAARARLEEGLGRRLPGADDPAALDEPVMVASPGQVKGLEFDGVVIADPGAIVDDLGWQALYVAATRATRHLLVVHPPTWRL